MLRKEHSMNEKEIVNRLREYAKACDGTHGCWNAPSLNAAAALIESQQADIAAKDKHIEWTAETIPALSKQVRDLQADLAAANRRAEAAVEDMLKVLLSQLEKEKDIISNEHGKDYAHLNFADGRRHTLMRVEAWAKTQIKKWRGQEAGKGGQDG